MKPVRATSGSTGTGATASLSTYKVASSSSSPVSLGRVRVEDGTAANARTLHPSQVSRPVDLDEIYEHAHDGTDSDEDDASSERSNNAFLFEPPETHRISALTQTLAEKQLGISQIFCALVHKMSKLVMEATDLEPTVSLKVECDRDETESTQESDATPDLMPADSSTDGSTPSTSTNHKSKVVQPPPPAVSSAKAKRAKCKSVQDQAILLAHKQARIAQQFEALVFRLEQDAIDRQQANAYLTRQLRLAKVLLRDEAGINFDDYDPTSGDIPLTDTDASDHADTSSTVPPSRTSPTEVVLESHEALGDAVVDVPTPLDSSFTIKEISFSNTVVDVGQMRQLDDLLRDEVDAATAVVQGDQPATALSAEDSVVAPLEEKTAADYLRLIL